MPNDASDRADAPGRRQPPVLVTLGAFAALVAGAVALIIALVAAGRLLDRAL